MYCFNDNTILYGFRIIFTYIQLRIDCYELSEYRIDLNLTEIPKKAIRKIIQIIRYHKKYFLRVIDTLEILQLALRLLGVKFLHILRMCLICPKPLQNFIIQLIFPKMHENLSAN